MANEISEQSQAEYNAWIGALQAEGLDCDEDLTPKERKAREEFDEDRGRWYGARWPAGQR